LQKIFTIFLHPKKFPVISTCELTPAEFLESNEPESSSTPFQKRPAAAE
jgi:hypothetical protein